MPDDPSEVAVHYSYKSDYYYLKTSLEFEPGTSVNDVDVISFKSLIIQALKALFGDLGAAFLVDILKYDVKTREAILRVENEFLRALFQCRQTAEHSSTRLSKLKVEKNVL